MEFLKQIFLHIKSSRLLDFTKNLRECSPSTKILMAPITCGLLSQATILEEWVSTAHATLERYCGTKQKKLNKKLFKNTQNDLYLLLVAENLTSDNGSLSTVGILSMFASSLPLISRSVQKHLILSKLTMCLVT